eukprot:904249-Karenia_brevis.AAC.1
MSSKGFSDHRAVVTNICSKGLKPTSQQPIPAWIAKSKIFKRLISDAVAHFDFPAMFHNNRTE